MFYFLFGLVTGLVVTVFSLIYMAERKANNDNKFQKFHEEQTLKSIALMEQRNETEERNTIELAQIADAIVAIANDMRRVENAEKPKRSKK